MQNWTQLRNNALMGNNDEEEKRRRSQALYSQYSQEMPGAINLFEKRVEHVQNQMAQAAAQKQAQNKMLALDETDAVMSGKGVPQELKQYYNDYSNIPDQAKGLVHAYGDKYMNNTDVSTGREMGGNTAQAMKDADKIKSMTGMDNVSDLLTGAKQMSKYYDDAQNGEGFNYLTPAQKIYKSQSEIAKMPGDFQKDIAAYGNMLNLYNNKKDSIYKDVTGQNGIVGGAENLALNMAFGVKKKDLDNKKKEIQEKYNLSDEDIKKYTDYQYYISSAQYQENDAKQYAIDPNASAKDKFKAGVSNSIEALKQTPVKSVAGVASHVDNWINDRTLGYNVNDYYMTPINRAEEAQRQVTENAIGGDTFLQKAGQFGYNTLMGTAEAGINIAMGAATGLGEPFVLSQFAGQSYASTYKEAKMNGLSDRNANRLGISAALIETGTEMVSLDHLYDMYKVGKAPVKVLKDMLIQGGIEASEEAASTILNRLAEYMFVDYTGLSEIDRNTNYYIKKNMSKEEARKAAEKDFWIGMAQDAGSGFFSGIALGAPALAMNSNIAASENKAERSDLSQAYGENADDAQSQKYAQSPIRAQVDMIDDSTETGKKMKADAMKYVEKMESKGKLSKVNELDLQNILYADRANVLAKSAQLKRDIENGGITSGITEDEFRKGMVDAINNKDIEQIANLYDQASNSSSSDLRARVDEVMNQFKGKAENSGITAEQFEGAKVSLDQAYNAGLKGVELENLTPTRQEAQNQGKQKKIENFNNDIKAKAETMPTELAKQSFIENSNSNVGADTYETAYNVLYKSAASGITFENVMKNGKTAAAVAILGNDSAQNIYKVGAADAKAEIDAHIEDYLMKNIGGMKKGFGTYKNISNTVRSDIDSVANIMAKQMNIDFVCADKIYNGDEGLFLPSQSAIWFTPDSAFSTIMHEATGEYTKFWNPEGYIKMKDVVTNFFIEVKGNDAYQRLLDAKHDTYKKSNPEQTIKQTADELANDIFAHIFATEEGRQELARWMTEKYGVKETKTTMQKIADWFKKIANALKSMIAGSGLNDAQRELLNTKSDQYAKMARDILKELDVAIENAQNFNYDEIKEAIGEEYNVVTDENGEAVLFLSEDESTIIINHSKATMEDTNKKLYNIMIKNGYNTFEAEQAVKTVIAQSEMLEAISKDYIEMANALGAEPLMTLTTDTKNSRQVFRSFVNNGEYPINVDFLTICKKRQAYMQVLNDLVDEGIFDQVVFDAKAIAETNMILRDRGFETACLGCFVESRRLQIQTWANTFVDEWNSAVLDKNPNATPFPFSVGSGEVGNLSPADIMSIENEFKDAPKNKSGGLDLKGKSATSKMRPLIDIASELAHTLKPGDLVKPSVLAKMRQTEGGQELFSLIRARYGSNTPKIAQEFNPYNSEVADLTPAYMANEVGNGVTGLDTYSKAIIPTIKSVMKGDMSEYNKYPLEVRNRIDKFIEEYNKEGKGNKNKNYRFSIRNENLRQISLAAYIYDVGGIRLQSFSDFMIENVMDYFQLVADAYAQNLPIHAYSKEIIFARIFGMTGMKINMSLIPEVIRELGKENAGLDANGNYSAWGDLEHHIIMDGKSFIQSIGYKDAIALQLDPRYEKNVGTIAIGVSDKHIKKMLNDPLIRMIIPYHSSGMNPDFAEAVGVDVYNDYTKVQNTRVKESLNGYDYDYIGKGTSKIKLLDCTYEFNGETITSSGEFAFNNALQRHNGDAKMAAKEYLAWCAAEHNMSTKVDVVDEKTGKTKEITVNDRVTLNPKFDDFAGEENYYKLLEDFNTYDYSENAARQSGIQMEYPSGLSEEQEKLYRQRLEECGVFVKDDGSLDTELIDKYVKIANMSLEELIKKEAKGRNDYHRKQDAVYEETKGEIVDNLKRRPANKSSKLIKLNEAEKNIPVIVPGSHDVINGLEGYKKLFDAGKKGDMSAATRACHMVISDDIINELKKLNADYVIPVSKGLDSAYNVMGEALAFYVSDRINAEYTKPFLEIKNGMKHVKVRERAKYGKDYIVADGYDIEKIKGNVVIISDDVVTSGTTVANLVVNLRNIGCNVGGVVALAGGSQHDPKLSKSIADDRKQKGYSVRKLGEFYVWDTEQRGEQETSSSFGRDEENIRGNDGTNKERRRPKNKSSKPTVDSDGKTLTQGQQKKFANSKALNDNGELQRVFHGTIREFFEFDRSYANPEGNMGSGFYFTNNRNDVERNYANEYGQDLTNKIEQEADMLEGDPEYENMDHDEIVEMLRKKYITSEEPITLECYLDIKNPVYVGDNETYLLTAEDFDPGYNIEDFEDEDEYCAEVDQFIEDAISEIVYSVDNGEEIADVLYDAYYEGGITLEDLKEKLAEKYTEDDQGRMNSSEIARQICEKLGYDGIIDSSVSTKFKSMGLSEDTIHYIVFNSNQAKLTTNENPTDSPHIMHSKRTTLSDELEMFNPTVSNVSILEEGLKALKGKPVDTKAINSIVSKLKNEFASTIDRQSFSDMLSRAFAYLHNQENITFNDMMSIFEEVAKPVIDNATRVDNADMYNDFVDYFKDNKIKLSDTQMAEIKSVYGSYVDFKKAMYPLQFSTNGNMVLDEVWNTLAEDFPGLIEYGVNEGDMPLALADVLEAIKPSPTNTFGANYEEVAKDLAMRIVEEYLGNQSDERLKKVVVQLKGAQKQYRADVRARYQKRYNDFKTKVSEAKSTALDKQKAKYEARLEYQRKKAGVDKDWALAAQRADYEERLDYQKRSDKVDKDWALADQRQRYENKLEAERADAKFDREMAKFNQRDQREQYEARIAAVKAKSKEKMSNYKDRQKAAAYKKQISKVITDLSNKIMNPTEKKHVPSKMVKPLLEFIQCFNFVEPEVKFDPNTKQYTINMLDFSEVIDNHAHNHMMTITGKTKTEVLDKFYAAFEWGAGGKNQRSWQDRMNTIKELFDRSANFDGDMGDVINLLDPTMADSLKDVIERNEYTLSINNLSSNDLATVNNALRSINSALENQNKAITMKAEISDIAHSIGNTAESMKIKRNTKFQNDLNNVLVMNMMSPDTFFSLTGDGYKIYKSFQRAFEKKIRYIQQTEEFFKNLFKGVDVSKWSGDKAEIYTFDTSEGQLKMNMAQIMSLYELSKRQQAVLHLVGGIEVENMYLKEGLVRRELNQNKGIHVTADELSKIFSVMGSEEKRIADALQQYMANECGSWGNEASREMYDIEKFLDSEYFPISTDPDSNMSRDLDNVKGILNGIERMGFTKEVTKNASNPIIIHDIINVFVKHATDMATYAAYAPVIKDALRVYNFKDVETDNNNNKTYIPVKKALNTCVGRQDSAGSEYFENFIRDINGGERSQDLKTGLDKLVGNYKAAAVGANIRVVAQQPTAFARAAVVIDPKYLLQAKPKNFFHMDKLKQENALIYWKSQGYYETNVGRSIKSIITGNESVGEWITDKSMLLAGWADDITWSILYDAAERQIKDTKPGLSDEEFRREVNDLFNDVITQTQVVDATIMKAPWQRSNSTRDKLLTSFMAEPIKAYNIAMKALLQYDRAEGKDAKIAAAKVVVGATSALLVTDMLNSLAQAIVDGFRYHDDDEKYYMEVLNYFFSNLVENINPINRIPLIKDVYQYIMDAFVTVAKPKVESDIGNKVLDLLGSDSTYGSTRGQMYEYSALQTVTTALSTWGKIVTGQYSKTPYAAYMDSAKALSQLTGMPVYNASRDFASLWNFFAPSDRDFTKNYEKPTDKYNNFVDMLDEGRAQSYLDEAVKKIMEKEGTVKGAESAIKSKFRSDYLDAVDNGDEEAKEEISEKAIRGYMSLGLSLADAEKEVEAWEEVTVGYSNLDKAIASGENIDEELKIVMDAKETDKILDHIYKYYGATIELNRARGYDSDIEDNVSYVLDKVDGISYDKLARDQAAKARESAEKKAKSDANKAIKEKVYSTIDNGTDYKSAVQEAQNSGMELSALKTAITSEYKDKFISAYKNGDYNTASTYMNRIAAVKAYCDQMSGLKIPKKYGGDYYTYELAQINEWLKD